MVVGVEGVPVHRVAAAPGDHRLGNVRQTERDRVKVSHAGHEAAVPGGGAADELGQPHGAVVARDIETLLTTDLVTPPCTTRVTFTENGRPYKAPRSVSGTSSSCIAQSRASRMKSHTALISLSTERAAAWKASNTVTGFS